MDLHIFPFPMHILAQRYLEVIPQIPCQTLHYVSFLLHGNNRPHTALYVDHMFKLKQHRMGICQNICNTLGRLCLRFIRTIHYRKMGRTISPQDLEIAHREPLNCNAASIEIRSTIVLAVPKDSTQHKNHSFSQNTFFAIEMYPNCH